MQFDKRIREWKGIPVRAQLIAPSLDDQHGAQLIAPSLDDQHGAQLIAPSLDDQHGAQSIAPVPSSYHEIICKSATSALWLTGIYAVAIKRRLIELHS